MPVSLRAVFHLLFTPILGGRYLTIALLWMRTLKLYGAVFLGFGTVDIWGWVVLFLWGHILVIVG